MTTSTSSLARAGLTALTLLLTGSAGIVTLSAVPSALAADLAPFAVTPAKGEVKLRSGPGGTWYAVASAKAGTVLRVDGEDSGYYRVAYMPGMSVVVKSSEAERRPDGTAVLSRPAKLSGLDMGDQVIEACYKFVLPEPLPAGTALKVLGEIPNRTGQVEGLRVEAPAAARAWVAVADVKKLSEADAAKLSAAAPVVSQGAAPKMLTPEPPSPTPSSPAPAATPPASPPATGSPVPSVPAVSAPDSPAPSGEPTTGESVIAPEHVEPPAPREPTPEELEAKRIAEQLAAQSRRLAQLDEAYRVVASQPVESAEVEPLIGEYQKFKESLGSDPLHARTVAYVNNRLELLRLRTELQGKYRAIAELRARADKVMGDLNSGIERIQKTRDYLVVGKLVTSGMYDGQRLPLLYRVQSVDTNAGRTLAYLTPEPGQQLEMKLGMIVGVKGDGPYDPSAKVNILVPRQVDVLKNADGSPMTTPGAN